MEKGATIYPSFWYDLSKVEAFRKEERDAEDELKEMEKASA